MKYARALMKRGTYPGTKRSGARTIERLIQYAAISQNKPE